MCDITQPWRAIIDPTGPESRSVERLDLLAISRNKSRVLPGTMRMIAIDPENRVFDAIPDPVGSVDRRQLHDSVEAKSIQSCVVEGS